MATKDLQIKEYNKMKAWLESQKHLPTFLRDFHDQKDLFKTVGGLKHEGPYPDVSWLDGHCYTIDKFLWWMAVHGYTMQKCRAKMPFQNLHEAIQERQDKEMAMLAHVLKGKEPNESPDESNKRK